ncbi:MAG: TetR family transcriptional regulator [Anaerolineaceae bacterium]|nr:TetR family transcriptional regulator [Anaerolineaceae bacterium]
MFSRFSAQSSDANESKILHDERKVEIITATQDLIAEKGFEGLRIRDVADKVGINNATLHYYFKTKEILIEAVVNHIVHELVSTYDPRRSKELVTPADELDAHLRDISYQIIHMPKRFIVLSELLMRSLHEPAIHTILKKTDDDWHAFLVDILQRGVQVGVFHKYLDLNTTSHMIMMLLKGYDLQLNASFEDLDHILDQVRQWVIT